VVELLLVEMVLLVAEVLHGVDSRRCCWRGIVAVNATGVGVGVAVSGASTGADNAGHDFPPESETEGVEVCRDDM
jgi:hypothetical protein